VINRRFVILTAVAIEARAIAKVFGLPTPKPGKPVRKDESGSSVEIHIVGIRAIRLPTELGDKPVSAIIMAGLGGALDPSLSAGDIVLDDCPAEFVPSVPHHRGKIHCSGELVTTPAAKRALFDETGTVAVDMESDAARKLAKRLGAPFISVRAISDSANDSLDPAVLKMVDEFGRPKPMAIAAALLRRPTLIPELRQLGSNANLAASNLATFIQAILSQSKRLRVS
jgi:adenosylhomocysteine nucleosidase